MSRIVWLGDKAVGEGQPVYIIAEIGLNHNGSAELAQKLIDAAQVSGCDAVKFQKRNPELCVPPDQRQIRRETPWGTMTYLEYRYRVEFGVEQYQQIDQYCRTKSFAWFASCWDEDSVDFLEQFNPICYKVPSACITDLSLLRHLNRTGRPVMLPPECRRCRRFGKPFGRLMVIASCLRTQPAHTRVRKTN